MRLCIRLTISAIILVAATACGGASLPDGDGLAAHARQAWAGDWHAVWQIEWAGAPVRGPLVAEVWHAADGRLRIETLEAPIAALSGLTLVDDGATVWFYDLRQNQVESGSDERVRIPLASDALEAIDWLLLEMDHATVNVTGRDALESGPATRLEVILPTDDQAALWVHDETGLPARVELRSTIWGEATFTTRSISTAVSLQSALFVFPQP
jgi:outer membrane lipoprotein-sorting protein